jgi:shikimate dehydrogenase
VVSNSGFNLQAGTDNYCVMGNPIKHSKSPQIHTMFARQCAQNLFYQAILIEPGCFGEALKQFHQLGGNGLNITVPFKGDAWSSVDHRSRRAEKAGAVNTIWFDEYGESHGDTTDGTGLLNDLSEKGIQVSGKRVLVLGAGGAVRGVLSALLEQGTKHIVLANRTLARAQELVSIFENDGELQALEYGALKSGSADIIINGTSASLQGELPPLSPGLAQGAVCYDMVYADSDTAFVRWAKNNGAVEAMDGLGMLVEQAAESFYIWRGVRPDTKSVIGTLKNLS